MRTEPAAAPVDTLPDPPGIPSPLVELDDPRVSSVRLFLKRDDLIDPELPGNKWRKLKYQLPEARRLGHSTLLTFGGAYSNHVRAVAAAGRRYGFDTIGVIRGEERPFNEVLAAAVDDGMRLHYLDRATYRRKGAPDVLMRLRSEFGRFHLIPEGGSAPLAVRGCRELVDEIGIPFDLIVCPVGTGGTLAGLSAGAGETRRALGVSVLRGAEYLRHEVASLQRAALGRVLDNWSIEHRFHAGGFARSTPELRCFVDDFRERHGTALEPVYVAKALWGVFTMIREARIAPGERVVVVITGPASPARATRAPTGRS